MRHSLLDRLRLHRHRIAQTVASAALFTAAGVTAVRTFDHPTRLTIRAPAMAMSTPVAARFVPVAVTATVPAKPTTPSWQLANIANSRVDTWVHRFESSLSSEFAATLSRGTKYSAMISSKLAARNMPGELLYLAMIESEFKPTARSPVSAVGLWQFMAGTARAFGLSVGRRTDERKDPVKETDAALTYLSQLHDQFGSWYLAAAAYNAGSGAVSRALRRVTGRRTGSDSDFYRISSHLPRETRDYVPKLIAAARVAKDLARAQ